MTSFHTPSRTSATQVDSEDALNRFSPESSSCYWRQSPIHSPLSDQKKADKESFNRITNASSDAIRLDDPDNAAVACDLLQALHDMTIMDYDVDDVRSNSSDGCGVPSRNLWDVQLLASDGVTLIPACRFVLAARSRVLRQMLYGTFREAKSTTLCLIGYDSNILRAIVHFCSTNKLRLHLPAMDNTLNNSRNDSIETRQGTKSGFQSKQREAYVRQLVRLGQAADYLELNQLIALVEGKVRQIMGQYPPLACVVFDEAFDTRPIGDTEGEGSVNSSQPTSSLSTNRVSSGLPSSSRGSGRNLTSVDDIGLFSFALRFIECRPYVTLDVSSSSSMYDCGGIGSIHDFRKVELIFSSPNVSASELFLFRMLLNWYEAHTETSLTNISLSSNTLPTTSSFSKILDPNSCLLDFARRCTQYIQFQNIEPNELLLATGIVQKAGPNLVSQDQIFAAVAQQALRSSKDGVWRIRFRPGHLASSLNPNTEVSHNSSLNVIENTSVVERVLVENAGNNDVNGMYYRIAADWNLSNGALYTKCELSCGQLLVYTLSCSTKASFILKDMQTQSIQRSNESETSNSSEQCHENQSHKDDLKEQQQQQQPKHLTSSYHEFRIFSSRFLTYHAIRSLDSMQKSNSTAWAASIFQPVLQVLEINEPAKGDRYMHLPMQIRKYYLVRLSDGEFHITATFARELSSMFEQRNICVYNVIKVLEFGLYQMASTTTIAASKLPYMSSMSGNQNFHSYQNFKESMDCKITSELNNDGFVTCIHVIKASVVTTAPLQRFGQPKPLEEFSNQKWTSQNGHHPHHNMNQQQALDSDDDLFDMYFHTPNFNNNDKSHDDASLNSPCTDDSIEGENARSCSQQGLQNLYICRCPIESVTSPMAGVTKSWSISSSDNTSLAPPMHKGNKNNKGKNMLNNIPRSGWLVDSDGIEPAPTCTWIPAVTSIKHSKSSTKANNSISK